MSIKTLFKLTIPIPIPSVMAIFIVTYAIISLVITDSTIFGLIGFHQAREKIYKY